MRDLSDMHMSILKGILAGQLDDAARDGRTGTWVDMVGEILNAIESTPSARSRTAPVGNEHFGTPVTFWSANWGNRHAVITSSPKPEGERGFLDSTEWGIVISGSGMTFAPAGRLTLGWHPDVK